MRVNLIIAVAFASILGVKADQPIKCKKSDVPYQGGEWTFHVSRSVDTVNLFQTKEVCTHNLPNKVQVIGQKHEWSFPDQEVWKIRVVNDNEVEASTPGMASVQGTWDILYQQALLVQLEDGTRFVANFEYTLKQPTGLAQGGSEQQITAKMANQLNVTDTNSEKFNQVCSRTMIGFVQRPGEGNTLGQQNIQCFYGIFGEKLNEQKDDEKKESNNEQKSQSPTSLAEATSQPENMQKPFQHANHQSLDVYGSSVNDALIGSIAFQNDESVSDLMSVQIDQRHMSNSAYSSDTQLDKQLFSKYKYKQPSKQELTQLFTNHEPSNQLDKLITVINNDPHSSWKADTCMLTKGHKDYDHHHCEKRVMLAQTSSRSESDPGEVGYAADFEDLYRRLKFGKGNDFSQAVEKVQSFSKKYKSASEIPDGEIPASYDLRNIGNHDFTGNVRDQGSCGSCYQMALVQVIEQRLKQKYGQDPKDLSTQQFLSCSYLNEGCMGGWAIFNSFLAENAAITSEACAPFQMTTDGHPCKDYEKCPSVAKIQKTYYLTDPTEKSIQKEILKNGAVLTDWNAPSYFRIYRGGIFKTYKDDKTLLVNQKDVVPNHASLIIGWGVDKDNTKYWIVRNSHGLSYGSNGDMHILRGENNSNIEQDIMAVDPEFV